MQIGSFSDTEYCQRTFLETLSKIPLVGRVPFFNILLEPDYLTGVDFMPEWSYVVSVMEEPVGKTTGVMSDE